MLSDKEIKFYSIKTGKNANELKKVWDKSVKEASSMGKKDDEDYTKMIFEDLIEFNESTNIDIMVKNFVESDSQGFKNFIEDLTLSDISLDVRPEMHVGPTIEQEIDTTEDNDEENFDSEGMLAEDEVEEDLMYSIDNDDLILDVDDEVEKSKNLLVDDEA